MRKMKYDKSILEKDMLRVEPNGFSAVKSVPNNFIDYIANIRMYLDFKQIRKKYYKLKNRLNNELPQKWNRPWEYNPYE